MTIPPSSRLAGLKDYIAQREVRLSRPSRFVAAQDDNHALARNTIQIWSKWAGQKMRRSTADVATVDEVHLFPGWAMRRPCTEGNFNVMLHVSGFATSRRTPEFLTRSQRAFLRLAKSFASIPKPRPTSLDTELQDEWIMRLPPRPDEISDDYDVESLDAHFRSSGSLGNEIDDLTAPQLLPADATSVELSRLHENLESRLKLFWASSLPSRRIQIAIFLQPPDHQRHQHTLKSRPILIREMLTGPDGFFSGTFQIDWHDIHKHPVGKHISSNQSHTEHELLVEAQIINTESAPELHETPINSVHVPITHSTVRVISDIDDTVKLSNVVQGARAVFNQVFVKDLEEAIIPGMEEWYSTMWKRGVRFHYVSNSPFELLPVINKFISVSKLPLGSVRLRSYAGRSLFNGLLSAPATRKRGNIIEILDHFPESQFLLVGDSGEQDLELYSALAAERPGQIAGVFIRDVNTVGLDDPTGIKADFGLTNSPMKPWSRGGASFPGNAPTRTVPKRTSSDTDVSPPHSGAIRIPRPMKMGSLPPTSYPIESSADFKNFPRMSEDSSSSIASSSSSVSSVIRPIRPVTEAEKKRCDLQSRVNKARLLMPSHIVLRVFEDPKECAESEHIVHRFTTVS